MQNQNEQNPSPELSPLNGQDPSRTKANWSEFDEKRRKDAIDLWRSLSSVNGNLPEDLIADELTAASDAEDLQTKTFGECWLRFWRSVVAGAFGARRSGRCPSGAFCWRESASFFSFAEENETCEVSLEPFVPKQNR